MASAKYGRLFTEADAKRLMQMAFDLGAWQREHDQPRVLPDEGSTLILGLDEEGGLAFPADEPLFLLRAQDKGAADAIETEVVELGYDGPVDYFERARENGASRAVLDGVRDTAREVRRWQREHPDRVKVPD